MTGQSIVFQLLWLATIANNDASAGAAIVADYLNCMLLDRREDGSSMLPARSPLTEL